MRCGSRSGSDAAGEGSTASAPPPGGAEVAPPTDLQTESLSDISDDDADEILNRDYEVRDAESRFNSWLKAMRAL